MTRPISELNNRDPHMHWGVKYTALSPEVSRAFAIARWEDDGGRVFDTGVTGIAASTRQNTHDNPSADHQWSVS